MKTATMTAILSTFLAGAIPAADYEITIDGKKYLFTDGVQQKVVTGDGSRVAISVSAVKTKVFQEHGVSFRYPSDMQLAQESFFGIKQVTLESTDSSLFILQILPAGTSAETTAQDLLSAFRDQFIVAGAKFPSNPTTSCKRSIGGVERAGVVLSYTLATLPHETEIYTLQQPTKTLAMIFQHAVEDKESVTPRFQAIASSFK